VSLQSGDQNAKAGPGEALGDSALDECHERIAEVFAPHQKGDAPP